MNSVELTSRGLTFTSDSSGNLEVLGAFNLELERGKITAIMAPSGAGKTTLLNQIAGLNAKDVVSLEPQIVKLGYCFQTDRLMPWLNILDNVLLVAEAEQSLETTFALATQLLSDLGLSRFLRSYPHQLSGGMRRRVALARSMVIRPEILLLDEAFNGLDVGSIDRITPLLRAFVKQYEIATIFVSHDPMQVAYLSDSVQFMSGPPLVPREKMEMSTGILRDLKDRLFTERVSKIYSKLEEY